MKVSQVSKKTLCNPSLPPLSHSCLSTFLFHFSPGAQPRVISISFLHYSLSSLKKRRVQKSLHEGTFGTLPPVLPRSPAVSTWHTFHITSATEASCDALWHKSIWNQMGLFPLLSLWGLMVQSGLDSHIDDPEGGALLQSVHKIIQPEMSVKHSCFFLSDVQPRPRFYICVCNRVFVLRADMNVCGLFCICVFVSVKGLTVISEVAKGGVATVIILFTSIMELNIEEVIAGSRHTTITSTQGDSFPVPYRLPGATESHSVQTGEALAEEPTKCGRSGEPVWNAIFLLLFLLTLLAHVPFLWFPHSGADTNPCLCHLHLVFQTPHFPQMPSCLCAQHHSNFQNLSS